MLRLNIKFDPIPDGDTPSLSARPRGLGITLNTRRGRDYTLLSFKAPTKIDEDIIARLIEEIDFLHPELEVLEYVNE